MTCFEPINEPPFFRAGIRTSGNLLEISSRSGDPLGRDLSAMNLPAAGDPRGRVVEAVYQGAKCYGAGGPDPRGLQSGYAAKKRDRERRREGPLGGFEHEGRRWPAETGSAFYDWLWTRSALARWGEALIERLQRFDGFTDQFHRAGAVACQAKTAAMVAGMGPARVRRAVASPEAWLRETTPESQPERGVRPPSAAANRIYAGIGSRETPSAVLAEMEQIARAMAAHGWKLRSGAAEGADGAFEAGARNADGAREIWLPWNGFNGRTAGADTRVGLNSAANRDTARRCHPNWGGLSDAAQKLMVRNVHQVLGPTPGESPASDLVLCWTSNGSGGGGTGMALRLARLKGIPVVDLGTADRARLEQSVEHARRRGLPDDVAASILGKREPAIGDAGNTDSGHRVLVTGGIRADETRILEKTLDELRSRHGTLTIVSDGGDAGTAAAEWARRRGQNTAYPPPASADGWTWGPEAATVRAGRLLWPRPAVVLECGGDWSARVQAIRETAELGHIPVRRCEGLERRPTGIEHARDQARAERERAKTPPKAREDVTAAERPRRVRSRYASVDRYVTDKLRLSDASGRIVRAGARRHRITDPETVRRALFIANSPVRDRLLEAAGWTTGERLEHDPLGVLTRNVGRDELERTLRLAKTVINALGRVRLEGVEERALEPAQEGTRQREVARERRQERQHVR